MFEIIHQDITDAQRVMARWIAVDIYISRQPWWKRWWLRWRLHR